MAPAALPAAFPRSRRVLPPSLSSAGLLPAVRSCQIQPSCAGRGLGSIPAGAGPGCELMMREPEVAGERLGWRRARRSSRKELSLPLGFAAALAALGETGKKAAREPPAHAGLCPGDTGQLQGNPSAGWECPAERLAGTWGWDVPPECSQSSAHPCAMSSVHPTLCAERSFPAHGSRSRGCPRARPRH